MKDAADGGYRIRLLIVEDQTLVREGLARLLESVAGFEVVSRCSTLEECYRWIRSTDPDVVLLDYMLAGGERGSDFFQVSPQLDWTGHVLMVTASLGDGEALEMIRAGVGGIVLKNEPLDVLIEAIRKVAQGEHWLSQHHMALLLDDFRNPAKKEKLLTPRERAALRGVCEGLSNKEIANRLSSSESTVKSILQQLFEKMAVRTRGQLVRAAMERYRDQLL